MARDVTTIYSYDCYYLAKKSISVDSPHPRSETASPQEVGHKAQSNTPSGSTEAAPSHAPPTRGITDDSASAIEGNEETRQRVQEPVSDATEGAQRISQPPSTTLRDSHAG